MGSGRIKAKHLGPLAIFVLLSAGFGFQTAGERMNNQLRFHVTYPTQKGVTQLDGRLLLILSSDASK